MNGDRVFTTGQAARLAYVSQQTIIRCVDTGVLTGHRVPGSRFRRIPERSLWKFMIEQGIPTDLIGNGKIHLLVVSAQESPLPASAGVEISLVQSAYALGTKMGEPWHRGVIIDYRVPGLPEPTRALNMLLAEGFASWRKVHLISSSKLEIQQNGVSVHDAKTSLVDILEQLIDQLTSD